MSEFRVEKRRAEAELTLSTGVRVKGAFFLAGSSAGHAGPERVGNLLNGDPGFFPFELSDNGNRFGQVDAGIDTKFPPGVAP
jgi:hypothetical protein